MLFYKFIKRVISSIFLLCIATAAYAGDMANFQMIGFSPEGDYFAFEQYGIHDGSGFPYSDIFIIETAYDRWVSKSPIRVVAKDESSLLSAIRDISAHRASSILSQFNISQPGRQIINQSEKQLSKGITPFSFKITEESSPNAKKTRKYSVDLKQWEIKNNRCQGYGINPKLFRLLISLDVDGEVKSNILYKDSVLPRSRGCPIEYDIHNVIVYPQNKEKSGVIVVIINVYIQGYEGRNRRFLAITSRFDWR